MKETKETLSKPKYWKTIATNVSSGQVFDILLSYNQNKERMLKFVQFAEKEREPFYVLGNLEYNVFKVLSHSSSSTNITLGDERLGRYLWK